MLKHRLADMRAARSPSDLIAGKPRAMPGADREFMVIDLHEGYQIEFSTNHPNNPRTEAGGLDWTRVSRIKILRIGGGDE